MIKKRKLSLSFVNAFLLISFMFILLVGIFISVYLTTEKIADYNVKQYVNQTNNITKIILESEQKSLNDFTFEISQIIQQNGLKSKNLEKDISSIVSIDDIDLIFLQNEDKTINYSNSLFDTASIIKKINKYDILLDNIILDLSIENENYIIFLSVKSIINNITGRVEGKLFIGKLLNDNFSIINRIKEKAQLEDVYIFFENNLIASTSNDEVFDMKTFKKNLIVQKGEFLFLNKKENLYSGKELDIVFITKNSTFELLKDNFIKTGYILFLFIILLFVILYFFSNKFIINPFSKLLIFAKKAKNEKNVIYNETYVKEFDDFAVDLKEIIDELRELKEQYSMAIEGVEDGFFDFDLTTKKIFFSNRFLNMIGFDNDENIEKETLFKKSIHKSDYFRTLRKLISHIKGNSNFYEDNFPV